MPGGAGRTLRVSILGVKVQVCHNLQILLGMRQHADVMAHCHAGGKEISCCAANVGAGAGAGWRCQPC